MQGFQQDRYRPMQFKGPSVNAGNVLSSINDMGASMGGMLSSLDNSRRIDNEGQIRDLLSTSNSMNYGKNIGLLNSLMADTTTGGAAAGTNAVTNFKDKAKSDLGAYAKQLDLLKGLSGSGLTNAQKTKLFTAKNNARNPKQKYVPSYATNEELEKIKGQNLIDAKQANGKYNTLRDSYGGANGMGGGGNFLPQINEVITNMNKYTDGGGISPLAVMAQNTQQQNGNKTPVRGGGVGGQNPSQNPIVKKGGANNNSVIENIADPGMMEGIGSLVAMGMAPALASAWMGAMKDAEARGMPKELSLDEKVKYMKNKGIAVDPKTGQQLALPAKPSKIASSKNIMPATANATVDDLTQYGGANNSKPEIDMGQQTPKVSSKPGQPGFLSQIGQSGKDFIKNINWKNAGKGGLYGLAGGIFAEQGSKAAYDNLLTDEQKKKQEIIHGTDDPIGKAFSDMDKLIPNPFNLDAWSPGDAWDQFMGNDLKKMAARDYNPDGTPKVNKDGTPIIDKVKNKNSSMSESTTKFDGKDFSAVEYNGPNLETYAKDKALMKDRRDKFTDILAQSSDPKVQAYAQTMLDQIKDVGKTDTARNYIKANTDTDTAGWDVEQAINTLVEKGNRQNFNAKINDRSRDIIDNILTSDELRTDGGKYAISLGDKDEFGENPMYLTGESRIDLLKKFMMTMTDITQDPANVKKYIDEQPDQMQKVLPRLLERSKIDSQIRPSWYEDFMTNDSIPGAGWTPRWADELNPFQN